MAYRKRTVEWGSINRELSGLFFVSGDVREMQKKSMREKRKKEEGFIILNFFTEFDSCRIVKI